MLLFFLSLVCKYRIVCIMCAFASMGKCIWMLMFVYINLCVDVRGQHRTSSLDLSFFCELQRSLYLSPSPQNCGYRCLLKNPVLHGLVDVQI